MGVRLSVTRATHGGAFIEQSSVARVPVHRIAAGGFARFELSRWRGIGFGAQAELGYAPRGADFELDGVNDGGFRHSYLELPLLARVDAPAVGPAVFYMVLGPAPGLLLAATTRGSVGPAVDAKDGTSSLDVALAAGAGTTVALTSRIGLTLEVRYSHGFINIGNTGDAEIRNRAVSFTVGVGARMHPRPHAPLF